MSCPKCKSTNITTLKITIIRPEGAKRKKCVTCGNSWTSLDTSKQTQTTLKSKSYKPTNF